MKDLVTCRSFPKGFSLVELMVSVAIVGVLAAMATMGVRYYTHKARRTEVKLVTARLVNFIGNEVDRDVGLPWTSNLDDAGVRNHLSLTDNGRGHYLYKITYDASFAPPSFGVTILSAVGRNGDANSRDEIMFIPGFPELICQDGFTGHKMTDAEFVEAMNVPNGIASKVGQNYLGLGRLMNTHINDLAPCRNGNVTYP